MTLLPFDEALESIPNKVLAWRLTPHVPGKTTVSIFTLESGGAVQAAARSHDDEDVPEVTRRLQAAGYILGIYSDFADFVWLRDGERLTVWDEQQVALDCRKEALRTAEGETLPRNGIDSIASSVGDDYVRRAIEAVLPGGDRVLLVEQLYWQAGSIPDYSYNDLLLESDWLDELARAIAEWAGTVYCGES